MCLKKIFTFIIFILFPCIINLYAGNNINNTQKNILVNILTGDNWRSSDSIYIKSITETDNTINVSFNKFASSTLITTEKITQMSDSIAKWGNTTGKKISYKIEQQDITSFIPKEWMIKQDTEKPLVDRHIKGELNGRTFALWNSHGRYYEQTLNRWEWQRARLFTTVEDILTASFVLPFLAPMLENAGANVFLPKERDIQRNTIIIDNNDKNFNDKGLKITATSTGYKHIERIENQTNPFKEGDSNFYQLTERDTLEYFFKVPEIGTYALYVCYSTNENSCKEVKYQICGKEYSINQQRGGGMWIYLGSHQFKNEKQYTLKITGDGLISTDAIKIGGGMGTIVRGTETSNMPAWMEGARYYLQANGFDPKVYSPSNGKNDYIDDINCRGNWVNDLKTNKKIDIDAVLALHTDAGIALDDSIIGTLTIVTTKKNGTTYSNGQSKKIAHDLAQIIEQNIVNDIRATWNKKWSERGIWDKGYSEAKRSDAPSVLIELLSHQNINDIRYALHPQFRFDTSRAIYKGLLRFFCGKNAFIQPLPVHSFGIEQQDDATIILRWRPTIDPLEPTAIPESYTIFANGEEIANTTDTCFILKQEPDNEIIDYHIIAKNRGGISFKSQILSVCLNNTGQHALLVEGFDRVGAPDIVKTDSWAGILNELEPGVGWGIESFRCGNQYDFNPNDLWLDDDCPGWGASFANMEGKEQNGSRLNSTSRYALELQKKGFSFVSVSKDYFESTLSDTTHYNYVLIALGNQKRTWYGDMELRHCIYTDAFLNKIENIIGLNIPIRISGSNIGNDIPDMIIAERVAKLLGFRHRTKYATQSRIVKMTSGEKITLPQTLGDEGYSASYDAIEPATKEAKTIGRYEDTGASAVISYGNITCSGF